MARIKGLDHGYLYTKDDEQRIFRSAYTKSSVIMGSTAFITIDGVDYSVGAGDRNIQFDKSGSEMNKVTTLTNLAMTGSDEYYLVIGLPIGQYASQKDKFKKQIMSYNDCNVIYKGKDMDIKINDVYVLPQGVGALLSLDEVNGDSIIFDFGGMTIDIVYIEVVNGSPIMHKYDTWTEGIQKLYAKIINQVNEHYNQTLDVSYAEKILVNGLRIHGEMKPLDFLIPIYKQYLEPIITEFQVNYPAMNTQIYLCGGSAKIFYDLFKTYYPSVKLMKDYQFANAIGYYRVGKQKFGSYIQQPQVSICSYRR